MSGYAGLPGPARVLRAGSGREVLDYLKRLDEQERPPRHARSRCSLVPVVSTDDDASKPPARVYDLRLDLFRRPNARAVSAGIVAYF